MRIKNNNKKSKNKKAKPSIVSIIFELYIYLFIYL